MKKIIILILSVFAVSVMAVAVVTVVGTNNKNSQYNSSEYQSTTESKTSSSSLLNSKKVNQQITANTILDRQISGTQFTPFNNSITNGRECLENMYVFNVDPTTLSQDYENNYLKKYTYLYLDGEKDSDIKVQKYSRDHTDDEPQYIDEYFYVKSEKYKNKLQAYHSYDIGTDGTEYEDEYFCYSYDDNGRLTETLDDVNSTDYFYYDDAGVLAGRTFQVWESDYEEKTYSYESDGKNIVKVYICNAENGNIIGRYEYSYDSSNRIVEEKSYSYYENQEKRLYSQTAYSYDNVGNISSIIEKKYNNDTSSYVTTEKEYYYNDNNNIIQFTENTDGNFMYYIFTYSDTPNSYSIENG